MTRVHWRELCSPIDADRPERSNIELERSTFYAHCARVFGFEGWSFPKKVEALEVKPGRDSAPTEIEKYGHPGIASYRNNAADAMQWLIMKGHLNSRIEGPRTDKAIELAWSEGRGRINTATRLADLFERAELTPLRSPDFEAVPGGSFGPRYVGHGKLSCMKMIQDLRRDIPPACMAMIEAIICRNEFPWHGLSKKREQGVFQMVRMSLDFASWSLDKGKRGSEVTREEMCRRWPQTLDWFTAADLSGGVVSFKMDRKPGS